MELLSCHFLASGEDIVRQQITFRYNSVKACVCVYMCV